MFLNSRRTFLKGTFLTTAVIVMSESELFGTVSPLQTIAVVQEDLFLHVKRLGINSSAYLTLILHHSHVTDDEKGYLRNGVQWLNEEAVLQYKKNYTRLSATQRQNILYTISKEKWGERWINKMLTYIMEATLGDPVYGANKKGAGWTWLNHASPTEKGLFVTYDVCIIGSGAGGTPIAYELSNAGFNVVVLEKGKEYKEEDFSKGELAVCRRDMFTPLLKDEQHVINLTRHVKT